MGSYAYVALLTEVRDLYASSVLCIHFRNKMIITIQDIVVG